MKQEQLYNQLDEISKVNKIVIEKKYEEDIQEIIEIFNLQYEYFHEHLIVSHLECYLDLDHYSSFLATALRKNMFSFFTAIVSTQMGLVGSARILFRNIFEFLIIGKYAAISKNTEFVDKWEKGKEVSLKYEVFSKVKKPKSEEMKELWKTLCSYTHSTIYTQQTDFDAKNYFNDVKFNLVLLKILLEMNFHLMNTYYINKSLRYYTQESDIYPVNEFNEVSIKEKKKLLKLLFIKTKSKMEKEPRKVIYDYKLKWEIKK